MFQAARFALVPSLLAVATAACGAPFTPCDPTSSASSSSVAAGTGGALATSSTGATGGGADAGGGGAGGHPIPHEIQVLNQRGMLVPGVSLVVNDATGAVVTTAQSDAWGSAQLVIPDGGSVSAFYSQDLTFTVTTFVAPPPGASIAFGIHQSFPVDPAAPATTYVVAASQLPAGTTGFACFDACDQAMGDLSSGTCQVGTGACAPGAFDDVMVVAYAGTAPLGWGAALHKPTSPGDTLAFATAVEQPVAALTATVTDIPAGARQASVVVSSGPSSSLGLSGKFVYDQPGPSIASSFTVLGGESTISVHEQVDFGDPTSDTFVSRDRAYQSEPTASTFSAASMALLSVSPLDVHDPAHPVVRWSVGDGPRGNVGSTTIRWHAGTSTASYTASFPPDAPSTFRVPDVPPELGSFAPAVGSQFDETVVGYVDYEAIDDYAGVLLRVSNPALFPAVDGLGTVRSIGASALTTP